MNHSPPAISFIGIVDFSQDAKWLYMTDSVTELLGYEPSDLIGQPSLDLVHPDEFPSIRQLHYDTILQDKAACLVYLRMKHKDPFRGYILCGVSRTVVHNVLVGSVSFASPGAKALHNASTAQEITVITPSAANFQFRRWHDPSPMPPSPIPQEMVNVNLADILQRTSPAPSSSSWGSKSPRSPRSSQSPPGRSSPRAERSPTLSGAEEREREGGRERNGGNRDGGRDGGRDERDAEGRRRRGDRGGRLGSSRSRSRSPSPSRSISVSPERSSTLAHRARNGSGSSTHGHAYDPRRNGHSHHPPPPPSIASIPIISFEPPANKSFRTAFILDRFTTNCTIMYCSNDLLVSTTEAIGRSFYDFVSRRDEEIVKSWIECVKGWGVNEKGQPSDGGFGFGRFMLLEEGRDSSASRRIPEPPTPSRHRDRHSHGQAHHPHQRRPSNNPHGHSRPTPRARAQTHTSTSSSSSYAPSSSSRSPTSPYTSTSGAYSSNAYSTAGHSHASHSHSHSPTSTRAPYAHPPSYSTSQITQGMHTMNVHGLDEAHAEKFEVDAIFSAHSDGLMVILRRAS